MPTSLDPLNTPPSSVLTRENRIIKQAIDILERRLFASGPQVLSQVAAIDYLRLILLPEPSEVFVALFLSSKHQVIACETLFRGTIDAAQVYPRVVVQRALAHNAAALIIAHQHPSGCSEPSASDKLLTKRLRDALDCVDVRLLDHIIIGKGEPFSFASTALL
ncbi:JAB domain-containing protein [Pseudomonas aeruginosa]|jgi:DNA repair protein RadC|uniref:JAB domain-containing protein n=1 Tax=Pseudomonas TaxID=286 RepID=UPI000C2ADCAD|nr:MULTISPECIES: JAB domain-containing protein [Pseudomonas]MBF8160929.1 DNA repair protein RadC [Pseudomonas mendocina]MEB3081574.1 JAB domain-containing protein [Pseudomonas aeruginosa]MEB3143030.1 JAB domain-containing protein [Pseudomonas aeruginosa]PJX08579.1 DNA repair protein RadC [Pseudomonas putida]HCF5435892.1 DNA repair protein RadC [Pseudomonas aeruginosa]